MTPTLLHLEAYLRKQARGTRLMAKIFPESHVEVRQMYDLANREQAFAELVGKIRKQ